MNVKSFVEMVSRKKLESMGNHISNDELQRILDTFDLDAVQKYIDEDIRNNQAKYWSWDQKIRAANECERHHRERLRQITEQWSVFFVRQSRLNERMLNKDFSAITESMKLWGCDAYPCQK